MGRKTSGVLFRVGILQPTDGQITSRMITFGSLFFRVDNDPATDLTPLARIYIVPIGRINTFVGFVNATEGNAAESVGSPALADAALDDTAASGAAAPEVIDSAPAASGDTLPVEGEDYEGLDLVDFSEFGNDADLNPDDIDGITLDDFDDLLGEELEEVLMGLHPQELEQETAGPASNAATGSNAGSIVPVLGYDSDGSIVPASNYESGGGSAGTISAGTTTPAGVFMVNNGPPDPNANAGNSGNGGNAGARAGSGGKPRDPLSTPITAETPAAELEAIRNAMRQE